jgi:signal transduction histidine kinase
MLVNGESGNGAASANAGSERSYAQLRAYATQVSELSAAAERNRLARDIHDGLGHHLTAIAVLLEKATAFRDRSPEVAQRALDDVRRSVRALRAETARSGCRRRSTSWSARWTTRGHG